MPTRTWVVGEEVLAADFNTFVQKQVVATFPNAAGRDAAIAAPTNGMVCYLLDTHSLQIHNGVGWHTYPRGNLGSVESSADSGQVGATPSPSVPLQVTTPNMPSGRRIRVAASLVLGHMSGGASHLRAAIYQDGGQIVGTAEYSAGSTTYHNVQLERIFVPAAGTHTYGIYVWTDVGTVAIMGSVGLGTLSVQDVGS